MPELTSKTNSQHRRIIARLNKVMNAKLVDWIVAQDRDPEDLPPVNTDSAIMLTDIRDFSALTEKMSSSAIIDFLTSINEWLARPLFRIEDKGGIAYTDKFMGDGMMNIFTDPASALRTAVSFRTQLAVFNSNPASFFKDAPPGFEVEVGTGIAYGPVTMGIMGHSRRLDYTPIGDTVNMASRLESLTKEYRIPILINDSLYNALDPAQFNLRYIDRVRVKGRQQPVDIYEEFSADAASVRETKISLVPRLIELQEMYFSGKNWDDAMRLAEELHLSGDPLPRIYLERMRILLADPELFAQWDGVYTFTTK